MTVRIHPLVSPWGRFTLRSFFIDAPEPAIVDTGIATSPAEGMAPALEALGRRIEGVRWILLTHGHIDHVGGAHALWELTGRRAEVVVHEADAPFVRSRRAHVDEFLELRGDYIHDPQAQARKTADAAAQISGEFEPTRLVRGGEVLDLGGDVRVRVHAMPGHTSGAVAYEVEGQGDVFVGDSVQAYGAASGFPGYEDADLYRASIEHLRDSVRPQRLYLGHSYRRADGTPFPEVLDQTDTREAIDGSLELETRIRAAARDQAELGFDPTDSPYSPFAAAAASLGYTGDPTLEPSPFFTTMHAYRRLFAGVEGGPQA
ncbi:MBL fold metallo-hydrolase [Microbacterium fluvii]|uniref:MBL fold metallo-hydrolase n=1 Tax=Microbacterium fluvii TaxID=415215 RepID=A0ABW2HC23_9MICO|nr:MBL fold metallo-hydrolase [Microbacterium fluvii]MCU4672298.1 MBL fold metallo-hydrolase [Microbacterium fluvii]